MGNIKYLFLCIFIFISCGKNAPTVLEKRNPQQDKVTRTQLEGELSLIDLRIIDLSSINKKTVLFFVSESCTSCIEETKSLVRLFDQKGLPVNVDFYSVLIGSNLNDSQDWAKNFQVKWNIGYDENLVLYKTYFSILMTPSMIIFNPEEKRVSLIQGNHTIDQIQQETGQWEY